MFSVNFASLVQWLEYVICNLGMLVRFRQDAQKWHYDGTGIHEGLKILWTEMSLWVRIPLVLHYCKLSLNRNFHTSLLYFVMLNRCAESG